MKIGIDIDDVVTETGKAVIEYAYKYEHLFCENNEITNNLKELMRGNLINEGMKKFVKTCADDNIKYLELKPNVVQVLNNLKTKGHQLIFITSRGNHMGLEWEDITLEYFKKHEIPYDKIIFGIHDKRPICLDENIDVFIDDSVDICNDIEVNTNIVVYLFDSLINKDLVCSAKRVDNWLELEELINK